MASGSEPRPASIDASAPLNEGVIEVLTESDPLDVTIQTIQATNLGSVDDPGGESEETGACALHHNDPSVGDADNTSTASFSAIRSEHASDRKIPRLPCAYSEYSFLEDELPRSLTKDGDDIITFEDFMFDTDSYETDYRTSWECQSPFDVRRLPRGGVISIRRPTVLELNDAEELFYAYNTAAFWSPNPTEFWGARVGDENPENDSIAVRKQKACCDVAEIWWRHWREKSPFWWKPKLYLLPRGCKDPVHRFWDENHVLKAVEKGVVPLWISDHQCGWSVHPAQLSAEVHIMLNSGIDKSRESWETHNERLTRHEFASAAITQHMGDLVKLPSVLLGHFYNIRTFRVGGRGHVRFEHVDRSHRRYKGRFPVWTSVEDDWFYESRVLIVAAPSQDKKALNMIFVLRDVDAGDEDVEFDIGNSEPADFLPVILRQYYAEWERGWTDCLDSIDASVKITLEDLSDERRLNTFMFDGPNFERSRSYFSTLQLLRIFSDHIKETRKDLQTNLDHLARKGLYFGNFQETLHVLRESEEMLLERIDRKTEEIKTLRDGLFNSTSVREATRATEMNRYVIVFTVVTVIYTPPSFISALFATPLPYFTKGDPGEFKQAVAIATGTTVLAALILLAVANSFDEIFSNPRVSFSQILAPLGRTGQDLLANSTVKRQLRSIRETPRYLRKAMVAALQRSKRQIGHDPEKLQHEGDIDLRQSEAADGTPSPSRVQSSRGSGYTS